MAVNLTIEAAAIQHGKVISIIAVNSANVDNLKKSRDDWDYLIPVNRSVDVGDSYDEETGIFYREVDGETVRVYPELSAKEEIALLKAEIAEIKETLGEFKTELESTTNRIAQVQTTLKITV